MTAAALPRAGSQLRRRASAVAAAPDATIKILGVAAVFAIWRLQEIIPGVGALKLPVLTLLLGMVSFFASRPASAIANALGQRVIQFVMAIAALAIIGGPFALVRGYSLTFVLFDLTPTLLLCLFLAAAIRSEADARWLLAAITIGGVVFCLYSRTNARIDRAGRPAGIIFYDANDFALLASTTAAVALGLAHTARSARERSIWLASGGLLLVSVLWTVSRGAFLALLASTIYLVLAPIMPAAKRISIVSIGLVGLLAVGGKSYLNSMKTMLNPEDDYNFSGKSPNGRGEVWKRGMEYVWERPLMGAGARNYTAAENRSTFAAERMQSNKGFKLSRAHNSYLEIAVELGIPGFALFVAALLEAFRRLHMRARARGGRMDDSKRLATYLAAGLAGFIVGAFFLSAEYWSLLYALIGIAAAYTSLSPKVSSSLPQSSPPVSQHMSRARGRRSLASIPASVGTATR